MEIFLLCWISRSTGLRLPFLGKELHSLVIYCAHRSMEIHSQSGGTVRDKEGKVTGGPTCSGNRVTGNARAQCRRGLCGEVAPPGAQTQMWACDYVRVQAKTFIRGRPLLSWKENESLWKSNRPDARDCSTTFHPSSVPCCSLWGTVRQFSCFLLPSQLWQWQ